MLCQHEKNEQNNFKLFVICNEIFFSISQKKKKKYCFKIESKNTV